MKRRELVRHLKREGCRSVREGADHEIFEGPSGRRAPLKRQREIPWVIAIGISLPLGEKPYWSTTSDDGRHCFVSWSGTDAISAISYEERREVARIDVGDHPQRIRTGVVRRDWVKAQG